MRKLGMVLVVVLLSGVAVAANPSRGGATNVVSRKAELMAAYRKGERLNKLGRYAEAARAYERAVTLAPAVFGSDSPKTVTLMNNLAVLYSSSGEYAKAELMHRRNLKIREAKLGRDHLSVAGSLNNLAAQYHSVGQYAKAEPLYLRSLKILEAKLGNDHLDVAVSLNNLTDLYRRMGQYAKGEPLCLRSLKIREAKLGRYHLSVAGSLNNLAALYGSMGEYTKAEPLHLRSLKIWEAKLGKDHPSVAISLNNLSGLYMSTGEYAKAEPLFLRSLKIRVAKLGKDHPSVAISLNNLAALYRFMAQYAKAEFLYLRSLEIKEAKLGKDHPSVAVSLGQLAVLYTARGEYAKAEPFARRAMGISLRSRARAGHTVLTRALFHGGYASAGDLAVCLALKLGKSFDTLELLERSRALGLRELLAEAKASASGVLDKADGTRISAALARINALHVALDRQANKGRPTKSLREGIEQAERDYDRLLAELGDKHRQFVATETARGVSSKQITRSPALDDATAILGWVSNDRLHWGYVVRTTGVKWVDLSKGLETEARAKLLRDLLSASRRGGPSGPSASDLHRFYRAWVAPLTAHLDGVRNVIITTHGWSAQLPLEMLLTDKPAEGLAKADWPWLDKKYRITYAPSCTTLDILCEQRAERKAKQWPRPLFALADPPFSAEQLARMKSEQKPPLGQLFMSVDPARRSDSMLTRLLRFDAKAVPRRLPGTRREARMIAGLLGAQQSVLLLGPNASERKLFEASKTGKLKQCQYVHLATHGFADSDRPEFSGLALARVPADKDYDGILHMREVFQLKLDADLVVLSACQTGLGRDLSGEGMLGLSTAFFFAGTPSIVMSLWNVPDAPTALLMHRFYSNLKASKTKAAALREAKNWLRNLTQSDLARLGRTKNPALRELSRGLGKVIESEKGRLLGHKPFAHPHYWAGFVLTGDPK